VRSFNLSVVSSEIMPFLREVRTLYILYMSVGIAAVPAGVLYGVLALKGFDRWWTALACVAIGLCCAIGASKVLRERSYPSSWQAIGSVNLLVLDEARTQLGLAHMAGYVIWYAHNLQVVAGSSQVSSEDLSGPTGNIQAVDYAPK
jgi:hypothetical protein